VREQTTEPFCRSHDGPLAKLLSPPTLLLGARPFPGLRRNAPRRTQNGNLSRSSSRYDGPSPRDTARTMTWPQLFSRPARDTTVEPRPGSGLENAGHLGKGLGFTIGVIAVVPVVVFSVLATRPHRLPSRRIPAKLKRPPRTAVRPSLLTLGAGEHPPFLALAASRSRSSLLLVRCNSLGLAAVKRV
jgi:hypothetical protein